MYAIHTKHYNAFVVCKTLFFAPILPYKHQSMAQLTTAQKRDWARTMYLSEGRTQAEIASICDVTRQTIIRWAKADHWDEHKACLAMTRDEQISRWQQQIVEINNNILNREVGERYANPKEADIIVKLTTAINKLETESGVHEIVGVGQRFIAYLRTRVELEQLKLITNLYNEFFKSLMR